MLVLKFRMLRTRAILARWLNISFSGASGTDWGLRLVRNFRATTYDKTIVFVGARYKHVTIRRPLYKYPGTGAQNLRLPEFPISDKMT